jgi:hypothetical protein
MEPNIAQTLSSYIILTASFEAAPQMAESLETPAAAALLFCQLL